MKQCLISEGGKRHQNDDHNIRSWIQKADFSFWSQWNEESLKILFHSPHNGGPYIWLLLLKIYQYRFTEAEFSRKQRYSNNGDTDYINRQITLTYIFFISLKVYFQFRDTKSITLNTVRINLLNQTSKGSKSKKEGKYDSIL